MTLLKLTKEELKGKSKRDFKKGDVIKVGKYFIHIDGLKTYANTNNQFVPLKESQMPQFIHNLVF